MRAPLKTELLREMALSVQELPDLRFNQRQRRRHRRGKLQRHGLDLRNRHGDQIHLRQFAEHGG